jgi:hypothetical protein
VVLDERTADFHEHEEPDRVVAALRATLLRQGERTWLRITASANGPRVDPPPGAEGVRGANLITSEELASILDLRRATVRVGGRETGRVVAGRSAVVPERRLDADGRVTHVAAGGGPRVVEAVFEAPLEGDGRFDVEIVVDGRVRASAACRVRGASGTILALRDLP